jgi:hypothetical protein
VDSIELLFYICQRQQADKTWLVDKLAESEEIKARLIRENKQVNETLGRLRDESMGARAVVEEITLQTKFNDHILDNFNRARSELLEVLEAAPATLPPEGKENVSVLANHARDLRAKMIHNSSGGSST